MKKNALIHSLARVRRLGHGVWYVHYFVEGYDEEFVMLYRGDVDEHFARTITALQLKRALGVKSRHLIFSSIRKEPA
jgi:hypothetical protein